VYYEYDKAYIPSKLAQAVTLLTSVPEFLVRTSTATQTTLTEVFRSFPRSLQEMLLLAQLTDIVVE
jgi:hypothetical protein